MEMKMSPFAVGLALIPLAPTLAAGQALQLVGRIETGLYDEGVAEIPAFDPATNRLFIVNGFDDAIDVYDLSVPSTPVFQLSLTLPGGPNSIAVQDGILAATANGAGDTDPGSITFFDTATLGLLGQALTGPVPDAVAFVPGAAVPTAVVAIEAEPDGAIDPEGGIQRFTLQGTNNVTSVTAGFGAFDTAALQAAGVRIEPGKTAAQDLEPEFVSISPDGTKAYVTLQENNAQAIYDIASNTITDVLPLGLKDYSQPGNRLDASDRDGAINIRNWPVFGMYMSDSVASYEVGGQAFYVYANEGDSRGEEERIKDLTLDPTIFPDAAELQLDENLGRLEVSTLAGLPFDADPDGDGDIDRLLTYGGRSFTIRDAAGNIVFDSGDGFEQQMAALFPANFNTDNDDNAFDSKSDAQGPEPEGLVIGEAFGRTLAFIGSEDFSGIFVYDITDPTSPAFLDLVVNRDFSLDPDDVGSAAGDLGPEGLAFVSAADSPTGSPLLIVANEVSGSTTIYNVVPEPASAGLLAVTGGLLLRRRRG
jgi:hypothetical protein